MRILLVHQIFHLPQQSGGTRHFEFGRYAVQRGHSFTAIAGDVSYLDGKRLPGPRDQTVEGVRVIRARMLSTIHRSFVWRVIAFLSFMCSSVITALRVGRIDVVMGTSPPLFQGLSAWFIAAVRRRPFVLEIRDLWPDFAIDMGVLKNRLLIWLARRLEFFLYRRATHLLCNSPAYREYLVKTRGVPAEKVTLISNGVDPAMFEPAERGTSIRDEYNLHGKYLIVYTGAIGPANDIPTIVRAAKRLEGESAIHFLLVGDGKDRPRIEAMMTELGIINVTLVPPRPKSEMRVVLGASDACVATLRNIPMFTKTYPNKVFDYMAAGRPTILGIDGVIRAVIEKAEGGLFVPPGDDEALADAALSLLANPEWGVAMGKRARVYVERHFNRADQAAQFTRLMEQLAPVD